MTGRINSIVAGLVIEGLRRGCAGTLLNKADLRWLTLPEGVPLEPYRKLLEDVLDEFGSTPLLAAGQSLRGLVHPLFFVLLNSDHPEVLIQKERRLNQFIHSRHQVNIVEVGPNHLVLEHVSVLGEAPQPTEHLAGCGQHITLLELIGAAGLRLRFPRSEHSNTLFYDSGEFVDPGCGRAGFDLWHFEWESFEAVRRPMEGLDEVLIDSARVRALDEQVGVAAEVERGVREDLGRTWKLDAVARKLDTSGRTLQRQLSAAGRTFSELLLGIRATEAARLLLHDGLSVTEIGYVCGFADTSHFSRTFKKRLGESPSAYRSKRPRPK